MTEKKVPDDFIGPRISARQIKRLRERKQARIRQAAAKAQVPVSPALSVGGRPRLLDPDQETLNKNMALITGLGGIRATEEEVASVLSVSLDTLRSFWTRYPEAKMFYEHAKLQGRASLRRNQFDLSKTHPQMAIWLGKQSDWLGQSDPLEREALDLRRRELERKEADEAAAQKGSRIPINVRDLDAQQLGHLLERIKMAKAQIASGARDVTPPRPQNG